MLSKFEETYRRFPLVKRGGGSQMSRCIKMSTNVTRWIHFAEILIDFWGNIQENSICGFRGILFNISVPSPSLFSLVFNFNQQKLSLWIYKFGSEVLQIQCTLQYHIQYSLKTTRVEFQINHTVWAIRTP